MIIFLIVCIVLLLFVIAAATAPKTLIGVTVGALLLWFIAEVLSRVPT